MTPSEHAEYLIACFDETESYDEAVSTMTASIERAIREAGEDAMKRAIADCIDRIGGDTYNGANLTVEELRAQFWDTHCSLERRAVEAEREACAMVCDGASAEPYDWGEYYAGEIRARSKVSK